MATRCASESRFPEHEQWLERFSRSAEHLEWLLFLHPEQRAVVDANFGGPASLSGVSGSGKTCVAIHRAIVSPLKAQMQGF